MHARELTVGDDRLPAIYYCSYCEDFIEGEPNVAEGYLRHELIDELYSAFRIVTDEDIDAIKARCEGTLLSCRDCNEDDTDFDIDPVSSGTKMWRCRSCGSYSDALEVSEECCR